METYLEQLIQQQIKTNELLQQVVNLLTTQRRTAVQAAPNVPTTPWKNPARTMDTESIIKEAREKIMRELQANMPVPGTMPEP